MIRIDSEVTETITIPMKTLRRLIGAKRHGVLKVQYRTAGSSTYGEGNPWQWDEDAKHATVKFTNQYTTVRRVRR